jgi:hypothetical protein
MSTCNHRLDSQTLRSQPIMPKNLPDHWLGSLPLNWLEALPDQIYMLLWNCTTCLKLLMLLVSNNNATKDLL